MVHLNSLSFLLAAGYVAATGNPINLRRQDDAAAAVSASSGGASGDTGEIAAAANPTGIGAAFISSANEEAAANTGAVANAQSIAAASGVSGEASAAASAGASAVATETAATAAASSSASAAADAGAGGADGTVLNFANTLERLESEFYRQALQTISLEQWQQLGISGAQAQLMADTLQGIQQDETDHQALISGALTALGIQPNTQCDFEFGNSFNDPITFLSVARTLEMTGTSAYLGGANLLSDKSLLTTAASIATVEGRHSGLLNLFSGATGVPQSQDIPLAPEQVLAIAGSFLDGCTAEDLGLSANQPLLAINAQTQQNLFQSGDQIAVTSTVNLNIDNQFCQMLVGGETEAIPLPLSQCIVPNNVLGPVALFVTDNAQPLSADVVTQEKGGIIAGPAMIFVDDVNDAAAGIFQSALGLQQLGSANLGISQFGDNIEFGQFGDAGGFSISSDQMVVQNEVSLCPLGGESMNFSRDSSSGKLTGMRKRGASMTKRHRRGQLFH